MHGRTCVQNRPTVPKFGTWDSDNAGYTVYFEKVRENKGATAPPLHRPFNPNDPDEGPMMTVPPPSSSSRPATSGGHRERHHHQQQRRPTGPHGQGQGHHRRAGSSSSAAAEQSKFAPPPQFQPRPSPQPVAQHYGDDHHHHRTGGHHQHQSPAAHGGGGGHRASQQRQQHHHAAPAARARSASPQSNTSVSVFDYILLGMRPKQPLRGNYENFNMSDKKIIENLVADEVCGLGFFWAERPAEADDGAKVRGVGRADGGVGGAGVHGAVREREAPQGGGADRRAAGAVAAGGRPGEAGPPPSKDTLRVQGEYVDVDGSDDGFLPFWMFRCLTDLLCDIAFVIYAQMFGCFLPPTTAKD
ncbi:hypothetical protein HU200_058946 [Digitaria exilis]|uniref:RIN4 pathogenic type III effector avirulence factor Avr cleavage site domain-containing protein n=1 Tax=Digitaria exilis TaxID=1010633 RepID=A0A835A8C9_9POAL|nr:hypothetical protein HU200_058946 [Digitaria exilis]